MSGKVVLVVEDEALIRMMLTDALEDSGFTVREAGTADRAIEILGKGEAIDFVVTDVRMPGRVDGIGLVAWMREHRNTTPVVVTSGYVTEAEAKAANPDAVVVAKPSSPSAIVAVMAPFNH